jgi:hypothetical protein
MARFTIVAALLAVASAFNAAPSPMVRSKVAASRVAPAGVAMAESTKETVIGAACVGGFLGVYLFHEVSAGAVLACGLAYGATLSNSFGDFSKTTGEYASKAYSKTLELNEQYDVLPKVKGAADTVTTAASNLDKNYGITAKVDEKLKLTEALDKVTSKIDDVKSSVSDKVSDLKAKATD